MKSEEHLKELIETLSKINARLEKEVNEKKNILKERGIDFEEDLQLLSKVYEIFIQAKKEGICRSREQYAHYVANTLDDSYTKFEYMQIGMFLMHVFDLFEI